MVLTSRKNDPKISMPLAAGKLSDPILAHWQAGLGKSLVFTSDPTPKWGSNWIGSPGDYNRNSGQQAVRFRGSASADEHRF